LSGVVSEDDGGVGPHGFVPQSRYRFLPSHGIGHRTKSILLPIDRGIYGI
jgi:hypothetical protein